MSEHPELSWPDTPEGWRLRVDGVIRPVEVEVVERHHNGCRILDRVVARLDDGRYVIEHADTSVRWAVPGLAGKLLASNSIVTEVLPPGVESAEETRARLGGLLARLHRDGGHREAEVGTARACEEADAIILRLLARADALDRLLAEVAPPVTPPARSTP